MLPRYSLGNLTTEILEAVEKFKIHENKQYQGNLQLGCRGKGMVTLGID